MYVETTGIYPNLKYTFRGTEAEILASTPKADQRVEAFTTDKTPALKYDWLGTKWSNDAGADVAPGSPPTRTPPPRRGMRRLWARRGMQA